MTTHTRTPLLAALLSLCSACSANEAPGLAEDVAPAGESDSGAPTDAPASDAGALAPPTVDHDASAPHTSDAGAASDGDGRPASDDAGAPFVCPDLTLPLGEDLTVALQHDGVERSYLVHVGSAVDATQPVPLIVNFHGLNNTPALQVWFSGMTPLADERGFIVVYPEGLDNSFAAGSCCGRSGQSGVDDLGFTRAVVADIAAKACVDAKRVYATGFSNGGYMSNHVGCRAADLFAAIAPIAGANATEPCEPSRTVPVFALNANPDPIVPYEDGKSAALAWVERNGCTGEPAREAFGQSFCESWASCRGGAEVRFCTWTGGTHLWPNDTTSLPASNMLLDFFARFALP